MEYIVKTINKLYEKLKKSFGDRLELIEFVEDEVPSIVGTLDNKYFELYYSYGNFLRLETDPETREIIEEFRPVLRIITNNFRMHFGYDYSDDGIVSANLAWDFVDPVGFKQMLLETPGYHNLIFYSGGLKGVPSLLAEMSKYRVPLPPEQRLTEEGLINLERRIAKAARKNDLVAIMSERNAADSLPCIGDGPTKEEELEKKYVKSNKKTTNS